MTDSTMAPAGPSSPITSTTPITDTTRSPYMIPQIGTQESRDFYELNLYVCRWIGEKRFVRVLGDTFEHGIYQIHSHKKNYTLEGEVVNIF